MAEADMCNKMRAHHHNANLRPKTNMLLERQNTFHNQQRTLKPRVRNVFVLWFKIWNIWNTFFMIICVWKQWNWIIQTQMIMKELFQRMCLKLETIKLKNPYTNDHERNVSTNVFKIGNNETEESKHKRSWKKCFNECV